MKKIISILSTLSIATSSILASASSIKTESKINNLEVNKNSAKNYNDVQTGDYLYAPKVKVNNIDDNPFKNDSSSTDESDYYDFVFLKSLKWDDNNMTINSSTNNISSKDNLISDSIDESQDITDYQTMETLKDQNGNLVIYQGLSLVNRYLNNGLLQFDNTGYIPPRDTFFSSLLTNNINDEAKQTVISNKFNQNNELTGFNLVDYLSDNLHWYGIDLKFTPKLISSILIAVINKALNKIADKIVSKAVDKWIDALAAEIKSSMFDSAEELMLELDTTLAEQPEVIAVLDPIYTAISYELANLLGEALKKVLDTLIENAIDKDENTLRKLFNQMNSKTAHKLNPNAVGFELDIDLHWWILNSKIYLILILPKPIPKPIPIPSNPSLIFDGTGSILTGTTNDFTLITNSSFWTQFNSWIFSDFNGGANPWLKSKQLWNSNITLTNSEWKSIILQLKTDIVPNGYAACIHIIRKPGSNFQIAYTNLTIKDRTNMPFPQKSPWLKASFIGNDTNNNLLITSSQLRSLLDAYDYTVKNWSKIKIDHNTDNPNKYTNYKVWFYHTYIANDSSNPKSDTSFWISNEMSETIIENYFEKYYQDFYKQNIDNKLTFSSFVANTTDNSNQILDISSTNL